MKRKTRLRSSRDFVRLVQCSAGLPTDDLLRGFDAVLDLILPQREPLRRELLLSLRRVLDGETTITSDEFEAMRAAWMGPISWQRSATPAAHEALRYHVGALSMAFALCDREHIAELLSALAGEIAKIGNILNVAPDQFLLAWRIGAQKNWITDFTSDHPSA